VDEQTRADRGGAIRRGYRHLRHRAGRWLDIVRVLPLAGWPLACSAALVGVALGLLPLVFVVGTSAVLDRVPGLAASGTADAWRQVAAAFGLALGALVVQNALSPVQTALGELVARRVNGHYARRLMTAGLSTAPMPSLERRDVLDRLADARAGVVDEFATPGSAAAGLLALWGRYVQLLGAVALVAIVLSPLAAALAAACACVARFGNRGSLPRWSAALAALSGERRRARYVLDTGSETAAGKEMRVLGILPWWRDRAAEETTAYLTPMWRSRRRLLFVPFLWLAAVVLAGAVALLLLLRHDALAGELSVLELSVAIQALLVPMRFGVYFPECDVQTQYGMLAHDTITGLEREFAAEERAGAPGTRSAAGLPAAAVRFDAVRFAYPGSDRLILDGLDLELPVGRSTAIVGLNGAGKTTVVKLLAGLYRPTGGRIRVDGADLRELDTRSWQRRLAVIFQDYVRYELDAAANIGLGRPAEADDHDGVRAAAAAAGADGVLRDLPAGLATPLSARYAGGVDLSGGQWQRIALARALFAVRGGASVLVLDEPTAQLDVRAEVAFFDRFLELTRGLTTVLISHRFATVRRADRIVVLAGGRVVEQGSHDELLALGGRYAELFTLQAARFADEIDGSGDIGAGQVTGPIAGEVR
jgi:ATP-binding cassette subfamily B protein